MESPYFSPVRARTRLLEEYRAHKKLIVALDFDDTVFDFHNHGDTYEVVLDLVKRCQKLGFYIILFTGAHKDRFAEQMHYLLERGVAVDAVNQNAIDLPFGNHGKIYYNILLDDRAGLGQAYETLDEVVSQIEQENLTQ